MTRVRRYAWELLMVALASTAQGRDFGDGPPSRPEKMIRGEAGLIVSTGLILKIRQGELHRRELPLQGLAA
jgi:hypothetical protein